MANGVWRSEPVWHPERLVQTAREQLQATRGQPGQAAGLAPEEDGPECPQCNGPTVWIGACYRCLRCGFKSACGQD